MSHPEGPASTTDWACLVYHDVAIETRAAGGGAERFSVPKSMFELVLDVIRDEGFAGCSLAGAIAARGTHRVAITFDDAQAGVYHHAMPALKARGMQATIYVAIKWVGLPDFMTWDQLREARDQGISVQSHTYSHPFLSELSADALRFELSESKRVLDRELGQDTNEIAFPGGDPPRHGMRRIVRECGYRYAVGTRWGMNPDDFADRAFVRRCTFRGDTTREAARRVIHGDERLALRHKSRELVLRNLRALMGPSRYAHWRRLLLDRFSGGTPD